MRYKEPRIGPVGKKILLILLGGAALILSYPPGKRIRVLGEIEKEWERINRRALRTSIAKLYKSKLVEARDNPDKTTTMILSGIGKQKALTYQIDEISIPKMKKWDGSWRIILFDVPEKHKKARDALARSLKNMGFYQFQKSVFIHPYECSDEIEFVIEFFNIQPYVRSVLAHKLDNELHLKNHFGIS